MIKRADFLVFILFFLWLYPAVASDQPGFPEVELTAQDRVLIMAPHPDDEVLGCAGIIQKALAAKLPVKIVFLTYGDNNEWAFLLYRKHPVFVSRSVQGMGQVRHDEAIAAAKEMGLSADNLIFLGYPDFGTYNIWLSHWGAAKAFKSMLTKVRAVPYSNALRPDAAYKGDDILKDIETVLSDFKPTKIFLSHPGDHNGDHRALYLFTRVALWDLKGWMQPQLYPYLIHFKNWPLPRGYRPEMSIEPPGFFDEKVDWSADNLALPDVEQKEAAIRAHRSQYKSCPGYLSSFIRRNELFGDYSVIKLIPDALPVFFNEDECHQLPTQEQLTDTQKAGVLGIERRYVQLEKGNLVLSMRFSRPLVKGLGITVYVFGFRQDTDFVQMPKLRIHLGFVGHSIYDRGRALPKNSVRLVRSSREVVLYIPLELLGTPQRILSSVTASMSDVPVDWVSWQIIELFTANK
ncbi:MAG: PIG-L deacetylase family protein [Candidatus Omnitrophota bacterium]